MEDDCPFQMGDFSVEPWSFWFFVGQTSLKPRDPDIISAISSRFSGVLKGGSVNKKSLVATKGASESGDTRVSMEVIVTS